MVERAAQVFDQGALDGQLLGRGGGEAVAAGDVDREHLAARALLGEPRRAPDQRAALGPSGQADDDALAGLPGGTDVVLAPVLLEVLVGPVGDPEERQLPQCGEVSGAEVVGERRVDLVGLVDVAVGHAAAQRLGRHVDEFDLVGTADDFVGDRLPLTYTSDRINHIAQRLKMLDVDGRYDVDARTKQFLDVLPALGVARARHVRVRQFVDEGDGRGAQQHGVHVHLVEDRPPVRELFARDLLQAVQHHLGARPVVMLDERHHAVRAPLHPAVCLGQHRVRLADARCAAEVDP